jgi:peptide/nickel transport system permease protein
VSVRSWVKAVTWRGTSNPTDAASQGYWRESWDRLREQTLAMVALGILVALAIIALCAPLISAHVTHVPYEYQDLDHIFAGPTREHLLGTDELGRDTLTRLVWGARVSLGVGFLAVLLSILIGGSIGMLAGYYGRWVDELLMRFVDMFLAVPAGYLLILMTTLLPLQLGPLVIRHDAVSLSIVIAVLGWGGLARLVRGEVLSLRHRDFVIASRAVGATDRRVMLRHLLPNALPIIIVAASLGVGGVMLTEAALDFIGLGVQPPTPSWGNMLQNAQSYFFHSLWLAVVPGLAIVIAVLAANIFGNAVRDAFDPRLRS